MIPMNAVRLPGKQVGGPLSGANAKSPSDLSSPMEGPAFQDSLEKVLGDSGKSAVPEMSEASVEGSKVANDKNLEEAIEKSNGSGVQANPLLDPRIPPGNLTESASSAAEAPQAEMSKKDLNLRVAGNVQTARPVQASEVGVIPSPEAYESLLAAHPVESELDALDEGRDDLKGLEINRSSLLENGVDVAPLLSRFSGKLEEAKIGTSREIKGEGTQQGAGLPARVSTEEFLNLRELRKEKGKSGAALDLQAPIDSRETRGSLHLGPVVEAPVTQGTAGKTILSHDALHQISHQVNLLGQARQDGEIKIRLKPDHLGELVMNVKSRGNEVSIQIKTHDLEAKKIIEESIGRLKESLSTQNLQLSRMDVVTQAAPTQGAESQMQMEFNQNQGGFGRNDSSGWTGSREGGRQEFLYEESPRSVSLNTQVRKGSRSGSGNLDLIA